MPIVITLDKCDTYQLYNARYYGWVKIGDKIYALVDKDGKGVSESKMAAEINCHKKVADPEKPYVLCRVGFLPMYRKMGMQKFMAFCEAYPNMQTLKQAENNLKHWKPKRTRRIKQ